MRSIGFVPLLLVGAVAAGAVGCSGVGGPAKGSPPTQRGDLGNGDFTFRCDDSVACERWSNSAQVFPDRVAQGANFELNYFLYREGTTIEIHINEDPEPLGYRMETVGNTYATKGSGGSLQAKAPGRATFVVRDGKGWVVDFTTIEIVKPEGLIVYDSEFNSTTETPRAVKDVELSLSNENRKSFRVVARYQAEPVAGAIPVQWTSSDPSVVDIESYARGKVTIQAKKEGTATLRATGSDITEEVSVEVKP